VRTRNTSKSQIEAAAPSVAEFRRDGRLARIARALASGATVTDIAEAEGIGRTLASREANSPECRQLIAEFVGDEWEEMRAPFIGQCARSSTPERKARVPGEGWPNTAGWARPFCASRRNEALP
jgi:hypothetical protein